ncbi:MAG TPA: aldehyde dehydrogenase family protein [Actinobacteria bacterium]|nr:aldehyde dehydrogenase family protein [Actinomycetota bacterium]
MNQQQIFARLGLSDLESGAFAGGWLETTGPELEVENPTTAAAISRVRQAAASDYDKAITSAEETFLRWRMVPAPRRGEYVRQIGHALRDNKEALAALVSLEMGKILAEGEGEVQEMIDIADFAVGLSRQLYGLTMASERPRHRMYEQWHPLGPVGVISAFNFPVAVWSWNSFIAAVCGDTVVWKPSSQTPLSAIAVTRIAAEVMKGSGFEGVFNLAVGRGAEVGDRLINDRRVSLVSATGSCNMGEKVALAVAKRLGRSLLELGGNNAVTVLDDADPGLVTRAVLFGAVGTAGQRCTTIRRMIVEAGIKGDVLKRLVDAYRQVRIGDPLDRSTVMGPLVNSGAVDTMLAAVDIAVEQGGKVLTGGKRAKVAGLAGHFVEPTIIEIDRSAPIVQEETFAPILYVIEADGIQDAIAVQNGVRQGLSSAVFTNSLRAAELFLSSEGSDCGIANVNIGTSGAEIGGAFGGEKETGGGREAGSDSWKAYMRRQTNTINWSNDLPLAQGIEFG